MNFFHPSQSLWLLSITSMVLLVSKHERVCPWIWLLKTIGVRFEIPSFWRFHDEKLHSFSFKVRLILLIALIILWKRKPWYQQYFPETIMNSEVLFSRVSSYSPRNRTLSMFMVWKKGTIILLPINTYYSILTFIIRYSMNKEKLPPRSHRLERDLKRWKNH